VGIRDEALSQKLQGDSTLTLEKAKIAIWQREVTAEQQTVLKEGLKNNPISGTSHKVTSGSNYDFSSAW